MPSSPPGYAFRGPGLDRSELLRERPDDLRARWSAARVLVVDKVVTESDKPARNRQRRLTEIAPGRYACTLSDAISPVQARAEDISKTP